MTHGFGFPSQHLDVHVFVASSAGFPSSRKSLGWLCSLAVGGINMCFIHWILRMNVETGMRYIYIYLYMFKCKTPCSFEGNNMFSSMFGYLHYPSYPTGTGLRYYMGWHSQAPSIKWSIDKHNGHNDTEAIQNPTEFILYCITFFSLSSKAHCMDIVGHF